MKKKLSTLFRVLISLGMVGFLVWSMRGNYHQIAATLARTSPVIFALAALLFVLNVNLFSLRLKLLLIGEGLRIAFARVIQLSFIGFFFNNFMPTAVGGDIVKAYYVSRQTKKAAKSFISVFMDRFIGLFSFICIALLALPLAWKSIDDSLRKVVIVFAACGIGAFLVILNDTVAGVIFKLLSKFKLMNIGERVSKIYRAVHEYKNKKKIILSTIGVSAVSQCIYFITVYLLIRSLGIDLPIGTVFIIMPIVSATSMLPSLGGLGLREGAIVLLFGPIIGTDNAFSVSILLLATLLGISFIGAIIYISASQFRVKPTDVSTLETYQV
ncbi:MAG: flippase-like domain-containing protein [Candidatus Omnitrophica bacterium]|nr:flippase-like domain-containing protein [Candidatus Omnitrophota bacterium]